MEWECSKCSRRIDERVWICTKCMVSRSTDEKLYASEKDAVVDQFVGKEPPDRLARIFSLKHRIGRIDFVLSLLLTIPILLMSGFASALLQDPLYFYVFYSLWLVVVFVISGKRCKDMDFNPWLGIPLTILTIGLFLLIFVSGTNGANQYGPGFRKKSKDGGSA